MIYHDGVWKNETVNYGITMDVDWDNVKNKPAWIGSTKPSYSFSEITGTPSVAVSSTSGTNLTVNVEGASKSVTSLYATYLGGTTKAGLFTGLSYASNKLNVTIGGTTRSVTINAGASGDLTDIDSLTFTPGTNNRNLYLSAGGMRIITTSSSGWGAGITVYNNANTTKLGDVCGAYGSVNSFAYSYFGGPYNSPGMTILANKNVGIGTTSPTYKLHVAGTAYATGGFQNGSDIRYKHVLQDLALTVAQVAAAPSFLFRWTDGTADGIQAGTSAQYWQQVLPQVVMESAGRLSMQYDKAALAAAIAVAKSVIDHEERIKRLENMIS